VLIGRDAERTTYRSTTNGTDPFGGPLESSAVRGIEMSIEPAHAPPEFAALDAGQWITATCLFDRNTHELRAITEMAVREPVSKMSPDETDLFWQGLPKTSDLPSLDWAPSDHSKPVHDKSTSERKKVIRRQKATIRRRSLSCERRGKTQWLQGFTTLM